MSAKFRDMVCAIFFLLTFSPVIDAAQDGLQKCWDGSKQQTLFIMCQNEAKHVLSTVSLSEGNKWRAYVDVDIQSNCLHTTRLWIAQESGAYRLVYLMPPKRTDWANGMEILGWAEDSGMLLVRTAQWQYGSDAQPQENVLAIDAGTGMVYEADLGAMMPKRKDSNAGFVLLMRDLQRTQILLSWFGQSFKPGLMLMRLKKMYLRNSAVEIQEKPGVSITRLVK